MGKSSKISNKKIRKKRKKSGPDNHPIAAPAKNRTGFILRNVFVGIIFFILFKGIYENTKSYQWVYEKLFAYNLKIIQEHPDYTMNQKHQVKLGYYAKYLNFISEKTPDSAIILMPPDSIINAIDKKLKMDWLKSGRHTSYFIYPRKPVYLREAKDSVFLDKITHVAIVDGYGYEHLPYRVRKKGRFSVLPLHPGNK